MAKLSKYLMLLICFITLAPAMPRAEITAEDEQALLGKISLASSEKTRSSLYLKLADYYFASERFDDALKNYRAAAGGQLPKKNSFTAWERAGDISLEKRDYADSIKSYLNASRIYPKKTSVKLKLASAYMQSELYEKAKEVYLDVLKNNPRSIEAVIGMGNLCVSVGLSDAAMDYYRKALTIKPQREAYSAISKCALNMGDYELSAAMLKYALALGYDYQSMIDLARNYFMLGRFKEAEAALSSAIEKSKDSVDAYLYLSLVYLESGDLLKAEKIAQIAREHSSEEPVAYFLSALCLLKSGRPESAAENAAKAGALSKSAVVSEYSVKLRDFADSLKDKK